MVDRERWGKCVAWAQKKIDATYHPAHVNAEWPAIIWADGEIARLTANQRAPDCVWTFHSFDPGDGDECGHWETNCDRRFNQKRVYCDCGGKVTEEVE